jgi:hypothetical protein
MNSKMTFLAVDGFAMHWHAMLASGYAPQGIYEMPLSNASAILGWLAGWLIGRRHARQAVQIQASVLHEGSHPGHCNQGITYICYCLQ